MKPEEVFYIHALARMSHDASFDGDHPLSQPSYQKFYDEILADSLLQNGDALNLFDRCRDVEYFRRNLLDWYPSGLPLPPKK